MRGSSGPVFACCLVISLVGACAHGGIEAAARGDLKGLKAWLAEGGKIDSRGGSLERTALHSAARHGQVEAAGFLLSQKADPNIADEQGNTPLCLVVRPEKMPNEAQMARVLAKGGADVEKKCSRETPLHYAAIHYKWDVAIPLLEKGATVRRKYSKADEPLSKAALSARADVVALMLKNGVDPNLHEGAAVFDALNTPQKDSWEVVKLLVENGANLRFKQKGDGSGDTALHRVVLLRTYGSTRIVDIMVSHGADPYAVNRIQELPLDTALDKSKGIASRMIKHMALELRAGDPLKAAYDKMVMEAVPAPVLATIERMMTLAGYVRIQDGLIRSGGYDGAFKDVPEKSAVGPANLEEADVYAGLVSYAGALVGALANAALQGKLDHEKASDNFNDLVSTVSADVSDADAKRVKARAGSSPAAAKIQSVIELLRQLEKDSGAK